MATDPRPKNLISDFATVTKENDSVEMDGDVLKVQQADVHTYRHKNGDLYAEDVDQHMAALPEMTACTTEITIDDI